MPNAKVLSEKQAIVEALAERIKGASAGILVDYKGITVSEDTALRTELRKDEVNYTVVKNTLTRKALDKLGMSGLDHVLNGTTSLAISHNDPIAPMRVINKFAKQFNGAKFTIKAGFMDGKILPLDEQAKAEILAQNKAMADQALRVLAAAERRYDEMPQDQSPAALEHDLTFLGLAGMIDPIRPEVKAAIAECKTAGIRAVMITGDHRDTAVAIAKQLGILEHDDQAITGAQLNQISDEELDKTIDHYSVYARVQPEHKVRIVNAWKKRGCITAMTGDGVNDAPSIRAADIGIGMGITGTDVTKNVADMVLADDNFATIVGAVEEGRRIYDNIRRAVKFLLGSNMSEVLSIFTATMLGFTILEPVHLLWINLLTDCFPALALGMERAEPDIMSRPPRSARESIFAHGVGFDCVYQGVMCAVLTLAAFFIGHYMEYGVWTVTNSPDGTTMAFLTLSMAEIFHSFNMRAHRASLFTLRTPNWALVGAAAASLALTTLCIYVPFLANAFDFTPISAAEYAVAMGLAFLVLPIVEGVKCVQRAAAKRRARA